MEKLILMVRSMIHEVFKLIYVGGERNYGLGRLELHEKLYKLAKENSSKIFGKFDFESSNDNIILKNLDVAISHVKLNGIELELGEIEPLLGLEWSDKGAGQKISNVEICATPGSRIQENYFSLREYGLLALKDKD